jgi:hypothetical protein
VISIAGNEGDDMQEKGSLRRATCSVQISVFLGVDLSPASQVLGTFSLSISTYLTVAIGVLATGEKPAIQVIASAGIRVLVMNDCVAAGSAEFSHIVERCSRHGGERAR